MYVRAAAPAAAPLVTLNMQDVLSRVGDMSDFQIVRFINGLCYCIDY